LRFLGSAMTILSVRIFRRRRRIICSGIFPTG
jgi:hypothetical protein